MPDLTMTSFGDAGNNATNKDDQPLDQQQHQLHQASRSQLPHQRLGYATTTVRAPPIDIYDAPDAFRINVALPGVPPECINIDYQYPCHELVIKGEVPWQIPFEHAGGPSSAAMEEKYSQEYLKVNECWPLGVQFSRRIKFPASAKVDGSKVTADLKYGVVYINVPKVL